MQKNRYPDRHAFTLIETLVVMAIIGVLAALVLSSVQMARQSVAKSACQNQIRQLALALH